MIKNLIEREIDISAPTTRVWAVLTDPQFLGNWFGNGDPVDLDLRPGGMLVFDHGVHGALPARIYAVEPQRLLSFRWSQGVGSGEDPRPDNSTLVEITLTSDNGDTRLQYRETGFAHLPSLPQDHLATRYEQNSTGLPRKLEQLKDNAEQRPS